MISFTTSLNIMYSVFKTIADINHHEDRSEDAPELYLMIWELFLNPGSHNDVKQFQQPKLT